MDTKTEIKLLKMTVRALAKIVRGYRLGLSTLPEWVFDAIDKAKSVYGDDLTKI